VIALAGTGPAADVALNVGPMGSFARAGLVFAMVVTLVAIIIVASSLAGFAAKYTSAGGLYSWVARSFGRDFGFVFGWLIAGAYVIFAAAGLAVFGGWVQSWFATTFHVTVPWWPWTLLGIMYVSWFALRGIQITVGLALALLSFEILVIIAISLTVVIVDHSALTWHPFNPSSAGTAGWAGIGLAMTYGVLSCVGFETGTTTSEEARHAQRSVGRGLLSVAIILPLILIFAGYAIVEGLGPHGVAALTSTSAPLQTIGHKFWGGTVGFSLIVLTVLSSTLAFSQVAFNAGSRVVYALGRDGALPKLFAATHRRWQTPFAGIAFMTLMCVVLAVPFAATVGPFNVWAYFGFTLSIMFLIIYGVACLAFMADSIRTTGRLPVLRGIILPLLGAAAMAYPLYRVVFPLPPSPYPAMALIVPVWLAVGLLVWAFVRVRKPALLQDIGMVLGLAETGGAAIDAEERLGDGALVETAVADGE
jgi:amino acid transporter